MLQARYNNELMSSTSKCKSRNKNEIDLHGGNKKLTAKPRKTKQRNTALPSKNIICQIRENPEKFLQ